MDVFRRNVTCLYDFLDLGDAKLGSLGTVGVEVARRA